MIDLEQYSCEQAIPQDNVLASIANLAQEQLDYQDRIEKLNEELETARNGLKDIAERKLPEALNNAGISEFKLKDGSKITIKRGYFPSIADENISEAHTWLLENGHNIIKDEVFVKFPKGCDEIVKQVMEAIMSLETGFAPERKSSIHWQTFRAWAKEQLEKGAEIPDTINIHTIDKAEITAVKKGKK